MSTAVLKNPASTKFPHSHSPSHATSRAPRKSSAADPALLAYLDHEEPEDDFVLDFDSESVVGLGDEYVVTGGKHPRFWLEDGNVVLVAKRPAQTQFRVHQSVLGKSRYLLTMTIFTMCFLQQDSLEYSRRCSHTRVGHASKGYTAARLYHSVTVKKT